MCYYNGIRVSKADYMRLLAIEKELKNLHFSMNRPVQNGFVYGKWPIVKPLAGKQDMEIVEAHWEFIAPWCRNWQAVEEGRKKYTTLNAIGETMLGSKLYRDAALHRRCLIPSSGFYEWRHQKNEGAKKVETYPYFISMADREYFYMAGIWQQWTDTDTGETMDTFAIVTTAANGLMQQIHNTKKRMPLILPDALAAEWIFGTLTEERIQQIVTTPIDSEEMIAWPVAKDFRTAAEPETEFDYPELLPLL